MAPNSDLNLLFGEVVGMYKLVAAMLSSVTKVYLPVAGEMYKDRKL